MSETVSHCHMLIVHSLSAFLNIFSMVVTSTSVRKIKAGCYFPCFLSTCELIDCCVRYRIQCTMYNAFTMSTILPFHGALRLCHTEHFT